MRRRQIKGHSQPTPRSSPRRNRCRFRLPAKSSEGLCCGGLVFQASVTFAGVLVVISDVLPDSDHRRINANKLTSVVTECHVYDAAGILCSILDFTAAGSVPVKNPSGNLKLPPGLCLMHSLGISQIRRNEPPYSPDKVV